MAVLSSVIGKGTTGARPAAGVEGRLYFNTTTQTLQRDNGSSWDNIGTTSRIFTFSVPGSLSVGSQPVRLHAPWDCTVANVTATVGTAPAGADLIVDVNKNGTTIFTTQANRPTIAAGTQDDLSSTPDVVSIAEGNVLTIDIDQVGSSTAGADLIVQVRVYL